MSSIANALTNRRNQVWEQAKALADAVDSESRNFSGEEQAQWDKLNTEIDSIDARLKTVLDAEQRNKDIEASMQKRGGSKSGLVTPGSDELRAFARGQAGRTFTVNPTGAVDYRTLSKLSAGAGADIVPTGFYNRLFAHLIETAAIMGAGVTVLNTTSGEQILIPKTTAHSTSSKFAEAAQITASDPAFDNIPLDTYKYAHTIKVSNELLVDSGVDLEGYLAMQSGRALGNALGAALVVGDGSGDPNGVHTASTLGATGPAAVAGGFGAQATAGRGADLLMDLFYSVIAPYRRSSACNWMMADSTAAVVRKLKDSAGQYVWQPSVVAGQPDSLLGKPVVYDPNVPAVAADAKSILFGDFSAYYVRLAGGVRFERSDDFAFDTDVVTFRAILRGDGDLIDTAAVKHFLGGAAS